MSGLFLFLDGVGLGDNDPESNPFAANSLPNLAKLLDGRRLILDQAGYTNGHLVFNAIDACLGVQGLPQSASGQTTILTGKNAPLLTGGHYGPKPNQALREILDNGTIFTELISRGKTAALLNTYPEPYFENINSGRSLHGTMPYAASLADIKLKNTSDLIAGKGISADFTGKGWHEHLNLTEVPILAPEESGRLIHKLVKEVDLAVIDYWPSDFAGHRQNKADAAELLKTLDKMLGGLLAELNPEEDWLLITSDHGNLEDLNSRRHTANPVPLIFYGPEEYADDFNRIRNLTGVYDAVLNIVG